MAVYPTIRALGMPNSALMRASGNNQKYLYNPGGTEKYAFRMGMAKANTTTDKQRVPQLDR